MCSSKQGRGDSIRFIATIYTVILAIFLALSRGTIGVYVIMGLHKAGPVVGEVTRDALGLLCLWPLFDGMHLHIYFKGASKSHGHCRALPFSPIYIYIYIYILFLLICAQIC